MPRRDSSLFQRVGHTTKAHRHHLVRYDVDTEEISVSARHQSNRLLETQRWQVLIAVSAFWMHVNAAGTSNRSLLLSSAMQRKPSLTNPPHFLVPVLVLASMLGTIRWKLTLSDRSATELRPSGSCRSEPCERNVLGAFRIGHTLSLQYVYNT